LLVTAAIAAGDPPIRGLLVPGEHATLSSRLEATILRIGPDNGESFAAGDVLVAFDCDRFRAEEERARAAAEAASTTLAVKRELAGGGSASRLQAVLALADLRRAEAEARIAEKQVASCEIRAPYAGRVVRRIANANETVGYGTELIEIAGTGRLEVRLFVPSAWLARIEPGDLLSFDIEETGAAIAAKVIATGAMIDNVSKLAEVRAEVLPGAEAEKLVPGMSGTVRFASLRLVGRPAP
jgi:RND family efflux transporter MFP subunit